MTEQEYCQAQFLEVGQLVQYKGEEAEVLKIDKDGWVRIQIKETGEFRFVRIEDLPYQFN